jgi:hypothetical protein
MNDYPDAPDERDTLREGQAYEDFVARLLAPWGITMHHFRDKTRQCAIGENPQGCEIKLDGPCTRTGRLSIELEEKRERAQLAWRPSGILRRDNTWLYVQGNYRIVFVFAKIWLLNFYLKNIGDADIEAARGTIRKFYLPLSEALANAALTIDGNGARVVPPRIPSRYPVWTPPDPAFPTLADLQWWEL